MAPLGKVSCFGETTMSVKGIFYSHIKLEPNKYLSKLFFPSTIKNNFFNIHLLLEEPLDLEIVPCNP